MPALQDRFPCITSWTVDRSRAIAIRDRALVSA
jgi:hypothetical protein